MKKKKLCMGAMALALSIGSVVQTSAVYTPVAYATEGKSEEQLLTEAKATLNKELTDDRKKEVEASANYQTANDAERQAYETALTNARNDVNDTTNTLTLLQTNDHITKIANAINGLGATKRVCG